MTPAYFCVNSKVSYVSFFYYMLPSAEDRPSVSCLYSLRVLLFFRSQNYNQVVGIHSRSTFVNINGNLKHWQPSQMESATLYFGVFPHVPHGSGSKYLHWGFKWITSEKMNMQKYNVKTIDKNWTLAYSLQQPSQEANPLSTVTIPRRHHCCL